MITVRRSEDRRHEVGPHLESWHTFFKGNAAAHFSESFAALQGLDEDRLPPGGRVDRRSSRDVESVSYVREGSLATAEADGSASVLHSGEFQHRVAPARARRTERNASRTDATSLFHFCVGPPSEGLAPEVEQTRFSAAERHGSLCTIASPDARRGSLRMRQDVLVYSALLDAGQHLVHQLLPGRRAWLHVIQGAITLDELVLSAGDGAGLTEERAVSLTAREATEILLADLAD